MSSRRNMKLAVSLLAAIFVSISVVIPASAQEDGAYLFKTYCAICHASSDAEERAPGRDVLKQMTPEHILQVLETGIMKTQASERSRAQRRILAEYLSEKELGSALPDLIPRSAFCSTAAPLSNTQSAPEWNSWGASITN